MTHDAAETDRFDPTGLDPEDLFDQPAVLGQLAAAARRRAFGDHVWIRPVLAQPAPMPPTGAVRLRTDGAETETLVALASWPEPSALVPGDRLVLQIAATPEDRARWVAWLRRLRALATVPSGLSIAPCSPTPGGTHRLWCIATARLLLPDAIHVEARHDLLGIRLAQLAVGFGADTLGGPIAPDRLLPLAGVTRPDETTAAGLATLVRHLGLRPQAA
ncbi:hypothetical protein [Paraliomyxa miuraensis]|uniref:hypothetical protein n=1 Tax=Paraliomyxa miuraensis TaxID=376150 RepID=UPI0022511E05|nr:hypothetical protein [Paraliomyxa miuraensis]MCX4244731.1 hypothetical protein [Paraliomyxa miuraensis]